MNGHPAVELAYDMRTPDVGTPAPAGMNAHAIRWMFHTTAMVADYDLARDRLAELAGLRVLEYSDNPQPEIGRRGGMCWIGDNSIELGEPTVAGGGAARFVERTGGGMHSVAVQVADADAAARHIEALGVDVAARPMPEMLFTDPRQTDGVFLEWGAFEVDADPRFGAEVPPYTTEPLVEVIHHAFAGAVVDDPHTTGAKLAELFGTEVTFEAPDATAGDPVVGVSLGDCTLALYAMPGDASVDLWGAPYPKPRCHLLGLAVPDLDVAAGAVASSDFTVLRRTESTLIVDPVTTGGVQNALVAALLPGDPRRH